MFTPVFECVEFTRAHLFSVVAVQRRWLWVLIARVYPKLRRSPKDRNNRRIRTVRNLSLKVHEMAAIICMSPWFERKYFIQVLLSRSQNLLFCPISLLYRTLIVSSGLVILFIRFIDASPIDSERISWYVACRSTVSFLAP